MEEVTISKRRPTGSTAGPLNYLPQSATEEGRERRMGIQERGAWHFHLLLFVSPSFGSVAELRDFITSSWYEICGKVSEGHLQAGPYVKEVRSWRQATSYMERYVAKPEQFPEGIETGRVWGVWNEALLPV